MSHQPTLTLVKNCGRDILMDESRLLARATKKRPIDIGPHVLAANLSGAFSLHVDDDGIANPLSARNGLPEISDSGPATAGEPNLLLRGEGVQVVLDRLHGEGSLPVGKVKAIPRGHLPSGHGPENVRVDTKLKEIRRKRFIQLLGRYARSTDLADVLEIAPSYVSRLKSGLKAIGDDARKWEDKIGLPRGWFDSPADVLEPDSFTPRVYRLDDVDLSITEAGIKLASKWESLEPADRAIIERDINRRVRLKNAAASKAKKPSRTARSA